MNDATDPDGRLEALLSELADLPPGDRPAFLDRVGDAGLRARLGRLAASLDAADAAGFGDPEPGPAAVGPGSVVGRYELVRLLGCGSSGEVYLARHTTMRNRRYAVKVLAPRLTRDRATLARFRREMGAVAALDHPNVVAGIDAELSGWPPYLATEYLDGLTVSALLRADARLPAGVACEIAQQVCRGLHALGERRFVHRDLSPANLFVTRAGVVKILDFGLVRLGEPGAHPEEWLTGSGLKLGNPAYLAPEQFREPSGVDPRADLYSLGCVLYQMLAGFAPFCDAGGVPRHELPDWHASRTPTSLRSLGDPVPAELAEVVERLLAKSPDDRPATAQEVEQCLAPFARPAALEARAKRFPEPDALPTKLPALAAPPSGRGQRRAAGLLAGVLLVAAAGAALVLDRPETRPGDAAVAAPTPESPTRVTNSVGMAFVPVPAGEFRMGSPADERGREADLEAQHLVTVPRPYFLAATEVTQGQYFAVTNTNPSHFAPLGAGRDAVSGLAGGRSRPTRSRGNSPSPFASGCRNSPTRRGPGGATGCRRKSSGSTPAGPAPGARSTRGRPYRRGTPTSTPTRPTTGQPTAPTSTARHRSPRTARTPGGFTTCTATSWSGWRPTWPGSRAAESSAAWASTTARPTAARRTGATPPRRAATSRRARAAGLTASAS